MIEKNDDYAVEIIFRRAYSVDKNLNLIYKQLFKLPNQLFTSYNNE
jgi:hypothetical protein